MVSAGTSAPFGARLGGRRTLGPGVKKQGEREQCSIAGAQAVPSEGSRLNFASTHNYPLSRTATPIDAVPRREVKGCR